MADNFVDNVGFSNSTLVVSGNGIVVGTGAGDKSVVFSNNAAAGILAWNPTGNRTISIPDVNGTLITNVNISAGTTSGNLSAFIFSNLNNVSFGINGSTITASINPGGQTVQTIGLYGLGNTTQNSSTTLDARTLSFNAIGSITVGYSNGSIQLSAPNALTTAMQSNAVTISNINLSAGTTSNNLSAFVFSNSNNVSFGLNGSTVTATITVPAQTVQTIGLYALGNTTQNSSSTFDARTLSFNGLGIVTVGYSNGSIQISATTAQSNQTIGFYAVGNTTGQSSSSTFDARTASFSGAGQISVGYSGNDIVISAPALKISQMVYPANPWQTVFSMADQVLSLQNISVESNIVASQINLIMDITGATNSTAGFTISLAAYTFNGSTLSLASSDSRNISWTSGSSSTNSSCYGGMSGTQYQTIPVGNWNLTAGHYMFGLWYRSTANAQSARIFGQQGPTIRNAADANQTAKAYVPGYYTSTFSTAMPASIHITDYAKTNFALQQPGAVFLGTF